ncbi:MAG: type I-F CRISPR-associated protein Csy2 [Lautropia sp.]|nr:type I-F CRISPR-associated protein Csy2 [Lautropia sp.]
MTAHHPTAILVLPHLHVQNANAIASPMTHGFPAMTAFLGFMWAFQRRLNAAGVPLNLHQVGVICHHHQEHASGAYAKVFHLTRNPVNKDGGSAAMVEQGRIHLDLTLIFDVSERVADGSYAQMVQGNEARLDAWTTQVEHVLHVMRLAGGSLMPPALATTRSFKPWLAIVPDEEVERERCFRSWRRQWLPGSVLVGRDDLLQSRWQELKQHDERTSLLDAWLHASRFNYRPIGNAELLKQLKAGEVEWGDPHRQKGSGWVVPIPVGYAALTPCHEPGSVKNARDASVPFRFVESIHSLGEWISPHRLGRLEDLFWHAETNEEKGVYRCRSGYEPKLDDESDENGSDDLLEEEDEVYGYD